MRDRTKIVSSTTSLREKIEEAKERNDISISFVYKNLEDIDQDTLEEYRKLGYGIQIEPQTKYKLNVSWESLMKPIYKKKSYPKNYNALGMYYSFLKNRLDKAIMSVIKIQEDLILEYGEYSEDSHKDMYCEVELGFLDSQIKYFKKEISKIDKVYKQLEKKNARK